MRFLPYLARLVFAGFIAALAIALLAGFGKQLGWWNFGTGLGMLPWAVYIGGGTVVLGIIWGAIAYFSGNTKAARIGIIGTLGAAVVIAFPLWGAYQAFFVVPPIHDITTDVVDPPVFSAAIVKARKDDHALNASDYYGATKVPWKGETKTVAEWQRKAYTDIHTVQLLIPPAKMYDRALKAAKAMGWKIVTDDPATGRIEASDTTFFFGFTDDIVIRVAKSGMGAKLDIRSESRVGISDVGKNASRIRSYLKTLANTKS